MVTKTKILKMMENENLVGTLVSPPKIKIDGVKDPSPIRYFNKGDTVKVERLPNSPLMLVQEIVFEKDLKGELVLDAYGNRILLGILCGWFGLDSEYREKIWNSKDIILMRSADKKTNSNGIF